MHHPVVDITEGACPMQNEFLGGRYQLKDLLDDDPSNLATDGLQILAVTMTDSLK